MSLVQARMRILLVGLLLVFALGAQAQVRAVVPAQASPAANRFYSPGVDAGDYVYVSGQGPRRPDGSFARDLCGAGAAGSRQCQVSGRSRRFDHGACGLYPGLSRRHQQVWRDESGLREGLPRKLRRRERCWAWPSFPTHRFRSMQSRCAIWRSGGRSLRRATSRTKPSSPGILTHDRLVRFQHAGQRSRQRQSSGRSGSAGRSSRSTG